MTNYIIYIICIIFIITIIFYLFNSNIVEHYCKTPELNSQDEINDKNVLLSYPPQSNIFTSSCDQYWKKPPLEYNSILVDENPIVIKSDQLILPKEKQFGNNSYKAGLIDFNKLAEIINDPINNNEDLLEITTELLVNPVTKEKIEFKYQLDFEILELNKKTYINRWNEYNPSVLKILNYDQIKSPIEDINKLNNEFRIRCNRFQKELLTNDQLIIFGLLKFEIFKYKILNINYFEKNINKPLYIIEISLFRESDLYLNTFSYLGYIENSKLIITHVKYVGRNSTDTVLLADYYNPNEIKQEIINTNFSNVPIIDKNPDSVLALTKKYEESFKLKNQYACFNINYNVNEKKDYILPYYSRESCESSLDPYGKAKEIGIYDKLCQSNSECPFYKINKNYDNEFGKCLDNGNCELPINMKRIGYHYYQSNKDTQPLCYNCDTPSFEINTLLDSCCNEQNNEKYSFLISPDYAFAEDGLERYNFFTKKYCKKKAGNSDLNCDDFILK